MTKPQPYPEYKYAGVPWLEDVPVSWPVVSTRVALRPMKVLAGTDPSKHQLLSLTKQGVIPRDMENAHGKHPENYDTYQVVDIDDLIFCLFDIDETPRTVGLAKEPGMLTGAYTRFKATSAADPRFICWYFLALDNYKRLKPLYTGLRKVIQKTRFLSAPMPLPELKVQRAIADFLDRETARIDELVGKQERLIKLLVEKRQAIITHAVTKGLDPTAHTKPTGIPWLGEVPPAWTVSRLKWTGPLQESGTSVNGMDIPAGPDEIGVLKTGAVSKGYFIPEANKTVVLEDIDRVSCAVRAGTLIVNRANTPDLVGSTGRTALDFPLLFLSDKLWQIDFKQADVHFIFWWSKTDVYRSQIQFRRVGASSSMQNLSYPDFLTVDIALPDTDMQQEIAKYLDDQTAVIDLLSNKAEQTIGLLRERRSALVSAAVTGKIDITDKGVAA